MEDDNKATDLVNPSAEGFVERVTPKVPPETVFWFKCTCAKTHFRHAGYMKSMAPFMRAGGEKRVDVNDYPVAICVSCKKAFVWLNEQMYDVTEHVDLDAWERTEKEAQKATGPGGQC